MDNDEAIRRIQDHIEVHKKKEPHAYFIHEALEKAITALKYQEKKDTSQQE